MAGRSDLLNRITSLVGALDEEALVALANKGLLRRARKDLANGDPPAIVEEKETSLLISAGGHHITLDERGPAQAQCSCPAPGCCQHILAVCLWLPTFAPATTRDLPTHVFTLETVQKWACADDYRRALRLVKADLLTSAKDGAVTFTGEIEVRIPAGSSLDAGITNAPPRLKRAYIAAGALAILRAQGVDLPFESVERGPLPFDLLEELQALLEEAVEMGLNHPSRSMLARLHSVAIQCRVGGLIRASLEAESCAREMEWLLERHALADQSRFFDKMTRLHALAESIRQQGPEAGEAYVGTVRSHYGEMGALDLVGVGCYPWETDSGFVGLTTLFWSPSAGLYYSWSDSRPKHARGGFTAEKRYQDTSPWAGGGLLADLVRHRFMLTQSRANPQRRLSAHAGSQVENVVNWSVNDLPSPVERWESLLTAERPGGLLRGSPLDDLVLLKPMQWGNPAFDEIEQALFIPLLDAEEAVLPLRLPYARLTAGGLFYLEALRAEPPGDWLLGYYRLRPFPHLLPIRLYRTGTASEAIDLLFQPLPKKKVTFRGFTFEKLREFVPLPQNQDESQAPMEPSDPLALLLSPVEDRLLQAAERGYAGGELGDRKELAFLRRVGLGGFADQVLQMNSARDLLRAGYCLGQLREGS